MSGNFYGDCWPGNSSWVDYLNPNAQDFWGQWFAYDKFVGSTKNYQFWNDMNEPAVFDDGYGHTVPMDVLHFQADGTQVEHRNLHNAYGGLHQKSSFKGLMAREDNQQRPFVLTRSFFMGSQKFGAYWTGDNRSIWSEL
jgi:alpha 1,3-glucosidase